VKKSTVWDLRVKTEHRYRVVFEQEVDAQVAMCNFNRGFYEDVIDEEEVAAEAIGTYG
jgi:hypothetical protein